MDRSFNSPISTKSPFSPRARQNITSKRIIPQSFRKSSRLSVSGKSTQSMQRIITTAHNYVDRFGQPLPVLITEALTFAERTTAISARISEQGYAWVVCGRRLLIWQYRQRPTYPDTTPHKKSNLLNQCFELQLPQSDLAHRAELITVFPNNETNTPSCIAVSPEGVVRYWPAIVHEGVSIEQCVDLQGQECDNLTDIEGLGCILATTTCTVVLIQPHLNGGRHSLHCKQLKTPTGWLGGISKKMSSLIFGNNSNDLSSETRLVRVLGVPSTKDSWIIYVLAGHSLQKWRLSLNEPEELVYIAELNRLIRDSFHGVLWDNCNDEQCEIDTWLLDIQSDKKDIVILAAAVNIPVLPQIHYALISIPTDTAPNTIKDFLSLQMYRTYREDNSADTLSYRFLLCGTQAYIYNQYDITVIKPQEEPDVLKFNHSQDFLLAGSICVNTPIFFSRNHGLVSVSSVDNDLNLSIVGSNTTQIEQNSFNANADSFVVNNLSIYNMDPDEISITCKDSVGQLKAAFIFQLKGQEQAYLEIINTLFPSESFQLPGIDTVLDKVVVMMCKDLLDDIPAGDPRWNKDTPLGLGSSYSMQVLHQLEDKQKAYMLFLKFINDANLWDKLGVSTIRNSTIATTYVLGELAEMLLAAIVLKSLPASNNQILEKAIKLATNNIELDSKSGLTNQDIYYREISKIYRGLQEIVNYCENESHTDLNPTQIVQIIADSNEIILAVFKQILSYRQQNIDTFKPKDVVKAIAPDYLPWTTAGGNEGLWDSLIQMHSLTYNYGITLTNNEHLRNVLLDHLVSLTDIIIDGRKCHLESIRGTEREEIIYKQYCTDRQRLIKPLLIEKEWERAAQVAEKYLDFESLIVICESTDNQIRLDEYMNRFNDEGFSDFAYNWFLKENKQGKLIDRCRKLGSNQDLQQLTKFLSYHPSLSWMQYIFEKKYSLAADTLRQLGLSEVESITRQKTIFSICKLAKLTGIKTNDSHSYINTINQQLELIELQEQVPDYVLQQFGYDTINLRVIPPKNLIDLYICKEYCDAGELEFKKALDLLDYLNDDEELKQELLLKIWRNAILRDSWNHSNLDSPLEILQNKLFFKIVDLMIALGTDPLKLLPPLETLIECEELKELKDNRNFLFLMRTGYEHIHRTQTLD